jgi:hypothetical protein
MFCPTLIIVGNFLFAAFFAFDRVEIWRPEQLWSSVRLPI